jgi:hypothetical protein
MRYSDFNIRQFPKALQDINGIKNYSLYLDLIEAEIVGKPLNESIDPQQIDSLERLKKLGSTNIGVGDVCDYVFVMLDLNGRLHVLGNGKQVILKKITNNEYRFSDGKTFPDSRWSKLSYSQLYIFDNNTNYEKFKTFLRLKFDVLVETTYSDFRLAEGYREVTQKFAQSADPEAVKKAVNQFRDFG